MKRLHLGCRTARLLTGFLLLVLLSGCSPVQRVVAEGVLGTDYDQYAEQKQAGTIVDGYYRDPAIPALGDDGAEDSVHVTLARNALLDITYYRDRDLTEPIDGDSCLLKPDDCLYAKVEDSSRAPNDMYQFERFRIVEYSEDGERLSEVFSDEQDASSGLVIQIPSDCSGKELSVEPVGSYGTMTISLEEILENSEDRAGGTWTVNDETISPMQLNVEVNSAEPVEIEYAYDATQYQFVSSEPDSFYHENGRVLFEQAYPYQGSARYAVTLRSLEGSYQFDPSHYQVQHGTVAFTYQGQTVLSPVAIPDGAQLDYTITPEDGYSCASSHSPITVSASNPEKTDQALQDALKVYETKDITVRLMQPETGGTIEYSADGRVLKGDSVTLPSGTMISMKFSNWNGWYSNLKDNDVEVPVHATGTEMVLSGIDGHSILNGIFQEADSHKPEFSFVANKSAQDIAFDVSAEGLTVSPGLKFADGTKPSAIPWLGADERILCSGTVGTGSGIVLNMHDDTIYNDQVLKLAIETEDTQKNRETKILYITKLPAEETIPFYKGSEFFSSPVTYREIKITASKVDAVAYEQRTIEHASVTVRLADSTDSPTLKQGDMLEEARNVQVTVAPEANYYITGANVKNNVYTETMKYSDWVKNFSKICEKHPVRKNLTVTLSPSDAHGTCRYTLAGKDVSGTITVREGDEITLHYTLTDSSWQIDRDFLGKVAVFLPGSDKSVIEQKITVTADMDLSTLNPGDYIALSQKEGQN